MALTWRAPRHLVLRARAISVIFALNSAAAVFLVFAMFSGHSFPLRLGEFALTVILVARPRSGKNLFRQASWQYGQMGPGAEAGLPISRLRHIGLACILLMVRAPPAGGAQNG